LIETLQDKINELKEFTRKKEREYTSFLNVCKYVEDVEAVIPLPEKIRAKVYGSNNSMVAINPEIVQSIAADFQKEE